MGVVYQAEDPRTEQFVAVKVLKPEVAGDHIARARLAREVETMRRVQSPNVAEVIDADTQAELPWVVTEYIPGPTLDATVTDHGPLRGRALTRFVTGMARAIKDIHAVEVIHRDLKPGNVIISNGEPIVIEKPDDMEVDQMRLLRLGNREEPEAHVITVVGPGEVLLEADPIGRSRHVPAAPEIGGDRNAEHVALAALGSIRPQLLTDERMDTQRRRGPDRLGRRTHLDRIKVAIAGVAIRKRTWRARLEPRRRRQ